MDYHGTDKDDVIDQLALAIPNHSTIFGGSGNDTITVYIGNAAGEAGNDAIIGTGPMVGAAYWSSPAGVKVNLATGSAQDGYGTTDKLSGIRQLHDSRFSDELTGSAALEEFWISGGSDSVIGGGGSDRVLMYNVKSTDVTVSYDKASATFTVKKNFPNGDTGTHTLKDVQVLSFTGPDSDEVDFTADMFDDSNGFLRDKKVLKAGPMEHVQQLRTGDFNGDGKLDVLVVRSNTQDMGVTSSPLQVLLGDGAGNFSDQSAAVFGTIPHINYVPRIFAADFNKDGISDIFAPDFGVDAPPFPGGQNSLYLSSRATGTINPATATLPQALRQNHGTSIGDVNKDGHLDLLVNALNEPTGNANQLLINDGNGRFTASQHLLPSAMTQSGYNPGHTWSMLRDLNNDGYDDIVLGTWDPNPSPSQVLLNDGRGSFVSSTPLSLPRSGIDREIVVGIETINLNGDALPDLILSVTNGGDHGEFYTTPYLQFLVNDGNGKFHDETQARLPQSTATLPAGQGSWYLSATPVDVNGDGHQDILVDGTSLATSKVYLNDGSGKFTLSWESAPGVHIVAGDVNGDGMPDLVEAGRAGFTVLTNTWGSTIPSSGVYRAGDKGGKVQGTAAAETVYSGRGNDTVNGGGGLDTMIYGGNRAGYTVAKTASGFAVTGPAGVDGTDILVNVERIQFADARVALDVNGTGGQAYRLYQAAFDRVPDPAGLGFHIWSMEKAGLSLPQVAQGFIDSAEFAKTYGNLSNEQFVIQLYKNVLHRAPDAAGLAFHLNNLDGNRITRAENLADFSESAENQAALIGTIGDGFVYVPYGG